jgi:murein DD-endopeptidase MepM/ murein hydrolase activator NlpD
MKTPINGARLSSGFGMRRHPILGYSKMHRGTDFAASTGTPIMAAGDGIVDRAGFYGGYGRYVRLRHSGKYATAYGHMSAFARGIRPGARVRQGQVIGYVGSSGASTGPHLHYEVLLDGMQINPMSMRVPTGRNLDGKAMAQFEAERDRIDALRAAQTKPLFASAAPAAKSSDAAPQRGMR